MRNYLMRDGIWQMRGAKISLCAAEAEDDEVGLFPLRDFQNFFGGNAVDNDGFRFESEAMVTSNEGSKVIERRSFEFVRTNEIAGVRTVDNVK